MPIQLITPLWGPLQQASQALSDSNTDFLVVGVCSSETTASTALVSALSGKLVNGATAAGSTTQQQLPGLQMHVSPRDRIITLDASGMLSPALLSALLCSDRPQPAVGSTAAAAVRAAARRAGSSSRVPVEGVAQLLTLQVLVFLCAVCNVVVVSSELISLDLLQLLEATGLIAASLPSITGPPQQQQQQQQQQSAGAVRAGEAAAPPVNSRQAAGRGRHKQQPQQASDSAQNSHRHGQQQQQQQLLEQHVSTSHAAPTQLPAGHVAALVLLQSCTTQQQQQPVSLHRLQQLVNTCLASTLWQSRPAPLLQNPALPTPGVQPSQGQHGRTAEEQTDSSGISSSGSADGGGGVAVWAVPSHVSSTHMSGSASLPGTPPSLSPELQQLVSRLLHYPRTPSSSSSSSSSSSVPDVFGRVMTEGEWLRSAERVWDDVQDSTVLLQYYMTLAEARLVGAGGWV